MSSQLYEFKTTVNVEGDDIDVLLTGAYIPKSICNEIAGLIEWEGDEIDQLQVLFKHEKFGTWHDITMIFSDETLEKLSRKFLKAIHSNDAVLA